VLQFTFQGVGLEDARRHADQASRHVEQAVADGARYGAEPASEPQLRQPRNIALNVNCNTGDSWPSQQCQSRTPNKT